MNRTIRCVEDWIGLARQAGFRVHQMAKLCDCSNRHLERHFAGLGCPRPAKWLQEVKLWVAVQSFNTGDPIKEAACSAGFKDVSYFYNCFRDYFDCTPGEFIDGRRPPTCQMRDALASKALDYSMAFEILNQALLRQPEKS